MGTRVEDWQERLAAFVESVRDVPFEWSVNDCVTLAAGAVEAVAGFDPMAHHRGSYRDARTARLLIARSGGLEALVLGCGCFREATPAFASRGDVVLVEDESGEDSLRVCLGVELIGPGEFGLSFDKNSSIKKVFKLWLP
jgi:hypothetical protein